MTDKMSARSGERRMAKKFDRRPGARSRRKAERRERMIEPVNRPTVVRTWWLVDVRETRTLKVFATGPKHARGIVAQVIADLYPSESFHGEPNIVKSFAHTVACDEGRSTRDRR